MSSDFKTASQEKVSKSWLPWNCRLRESRVKTVDEACRCCYSEGFRESGHTAKVYREPYGVTLVIGPFNGPLTLLFDPAVQVIAAGNPCILKLSEVCPQQVNSYSSRTEVLRFSCRHCRLGKQEKLRSFSSCRLTSSSSPEASRWGDRHGAAAKNLTPVLLELGDRIPRS